MKNFSINARIKELRLNFRYKQSEFGEQIGIKASAVGRMEQEGSSVTKQSIMLICQAFRVRREWLETGEGEMFNTWEPGIFREFAKEYELSIPEQQVAKYLLKLSHAERERILAHLSEIALALQKGRKMEQSERKKSLLFVAESPADNSDK